MLKYIFIFCFIIPFTLINGQTVQKEQLAKTIDIANLKHPYIYFSAAEKQAILDRIDKDAETNDIWRKQLAEANMLLQIPVDNTIPERGRNTRAGWTETDRANEYERKLRSYRSYAYDLAFVYQMTGEQKYAQKAFDFAAVICEYPSWTMQAHTFPIIYSRIMPWNVPDDQVNFNFDLGNSATGRSLALMYDWTYEALSVPQRDKIRGALLENVITPVRGDYEFHWWTTSYRCNWTGVCFSGFGTTALALLGEHPQLVDALTESYNGIYQMMDQLGQDGGWQEGGSYWRFGLETSAKFAYALKRITNGKYNLFQHPKLKDNPVNFPVNLYLAPNRSVDFGDSGNKVIRHSSFLNLLAQETQSGTAAWYRNLTGQKGRKIEDILFPRPTIEPTPPKNTSKHFRSIDWWVLRSDFESTDKVVIAGKAGLNDDPHHGHLDIGHFILHWQGQNFIKDAGKVYYDEKFFDEVRWEYPQANSEGHNVVFVNGEGQISGKHRKQPFDYSIGGKVLDFQTSEQKDYVLMNPTNAYPKKELKNWRRHVILTKPNLTLIVDEIEATKKAAEIEVRFHTEAKAKVEEKSLHLKGKEGQMLLLSLSGDDLTIKEGKHAYQPVHATREFEWIPYYGIHTKSKETVIATLILPIENEEEIDAIKKTAKLTIKGTQLTISLNFKNKTHNYSFEKEAIGWTYKS
ncbi:MAG: heparinase II/III family protein [Saprospiraceae bacterium]